MDLSDCAAQAQPGGFLHVRLLAMQLLPHGLLSSQILQQEAAPAGIIQIANAMSAMRILAMPSAYH
jgi:hypothetical protein